MQWIFYYWKTHNSLGLLWIHACGEQGIQEPNSMGSKK